MKNFLSLLLSTVMLFTITAGIDMSAYAASNYEFESNNSYSTANNLPVNSSISGTLNDGTNDFFVINADVTGYMDITFSHEWHEYNNGWYLEVFKHNRNENKYEPISSEIIVYMNSGSYKVPRIGVKKNEKYYIKISSYYVEKNLEYTISNKLIESQYYECETNDTFYNPTVVNLGSYKYAYINSTTDIDVFKIVVPSGTVCNITLTHDYVDNGCEWILELYKYKSSDNSFNLISTESMYPNGGSFSFQKYNTGIYYLRVKDRWNSRYAATEGIRYKVEVKPNISTPSNFRISSRGTKSLKLAWNKVSGVSGYQLQRKSGDSYKTVANTKSTSCTVSKLSAGTSYAFRVRAYKTIDGKKYYSSWRTLTTPTKPLTPSIKTPSTNKKHQIIVKWNRVFKCTGYQVQFSRKKNFSSVIATKIVSGSSKTSYTGKNFTKGKTYYVRVRAYKTVNGTKYCGAWSKVKSIKCK